MSIWSRGAITLLVVVWIAVAIGHWAAHQDVVQEKLGQGEQEGTPQEVNIPAAKIKPWKGDISKYQEELDEENSGALRGEKKDAELVVATPVTQPANAEASAAQPNGAGLNSDNGAKYYLIFASYHHEAQAAEMLTRLSAKKVEGKIESLTDSDGSKLYRVVGVQEYDDQETAEASKGAMLKIGFDAFVASR